jgi:hypothetical protein
MTRSFHNDGLLIGAICHLITAVWIYYPMNNSNSEFKKSYNGNMRKAAEQPGAGGGETTGQSEGKQRADLCNRGYGKECAGGILLSTHEAAVQSH